MAEASILWAQDQFSCSICLDLLKDPVTVPCGHSYCMSCITDYWDQDEDDDNEEEGVYSCPQCRRAFTPRPVLGKNVVFAEMIEKLIKLQTPHPAPCYAGPGDVECDICSTERKHKAVKSCLECLESYCQSHFERHEEFRSGKRHKVTDATGSLQEMICPQHHKLLEIFCRTDKQCICMMCTVYEHKNHDTVSAEARRTEIEKNLMKTQKKLKKSIEQKQKDLQEVKEAVRSYKRSAQTAVEDCEIMFTELISSIEKSRSEVTQLIRDQEKTSVIPAEEQLERMKQDIDALRRRDAELEQLSQTHDHIHFLKVFQGISAPPESTVIFPVSPVCSFNGIIKSISKLKERLETLCNQEVARISAGGRDAYSSHPSLLTDSCIATQARVLETEEVIPVLEVVPVLETEEVTQAWENEEVVSFWETEEVTPVLETEEAVPILETDETVPILETEEAVPNFETEEVIPILETEEAIQAWETQEVVPGLETERIFSFWETEEDVPVLETDKVLQAWETEETDQVLETEEVVSLWETEEDVPVLETEEVIQAWETQEVVPGLETERIFSFWETEEDVPVLETDKVLQAWETEETDQVLETEEVVSFWETEEDVPVLETEEVIQAWETEEAVPDFETEEVVSFWGTEEVVSFWETDEVDPVLETEDVFQACDTEEPSAILESEEECLFREIEDEEVGSFWENEDEEVGSFW
ncbi:E3 ubiquitin-protein ligase TRIM47-like isoform X3 [Paramisgurnus dabryanus]|uniref:E3 ubiquitin-protein ligase TRIM47-like isoform X3 n=1 Tax=Paramisgurnus dabryanus TaxID=90735 RepID=UPI003CCF9039